MHATQFVLAISTRTYLTLPVRHLGDVPDGLPIGYGTGRLGDARVEMIFFRFWRGYSGLKTPLRVPKSFFGVAALLNSSGPKAQAGGGPIPAAASKRSEIRSQPIVRLRVLFSPL